VQELFLYEFGRTFKGGQLWRPITSALHLGKVDMGFASQLYFLILYGQEMERQDGSAQHCVFIVTQVGGDRVVCVIRLVRNSFT